MTAKLIALYKNPKDQKAFDEHYFNIHSPLAEKMPGLRKLEVTRITGSPMGEAEFYLLAEMTFDSMEALKAALASDEGKAAGKDLMGFAGDLVKLYFAEPANQPAEVGS